MPNDFPIKDPQSIWQNQPAEALKMSATEVRHRARQRQARDRLEANVAIIVGLVCSAFFAWTCTRADAALARAGWGLLSLWGIYAAYYAWKWMAPQDPPEADAPITTCLEFYRRELEKRRDHLRHRWWRLGMPVMLLGMTMVIVGTGAPKAPPNPLLNAVPFFLVLAVWAVAFFTIKKKLGRENLEEEIEDLRAFENENRS